MNGDFRINCIDITQCELCILYPETYPKEDYPGWDANEDDEGPNAGDVLAVELRILELWPPITPTPTPSATPTLSATPTATITPPPSPTWYPMDSNTSETLYGISNADYFHDLVSLFAVGANGTIVRYWYNGSSGFEWIGMDSNTSSDLYDVCSYLCTDTSPCCEDRVPAYAAGGTTSSNGTILHYNGSANHSTWEPVNLSTERLYGMRCSADMDCDLSQYYRLAYAVGVDGTIAHLNGTDWSYMSSNTTETLRDLWGQWELYAVGDNGTVLYYDEVNWSQINTNTTAVLEGVWAGSFGDVFVVGEDGLILRYNNSAWSEMDSGTSVSLHDIWGIETGGLYHDDIFAVGDNGTILRYNGSAWNPMESGTSADLYDLWCYGGGNYASEIFAVGEEGIILHLYTAEYQYELVKYQVQTAVIAYSTGHNGDLPPTTNGTLDGTDVSTPQGTFGDELQILDICSLVGETEGMLSQIPEGPMDPVVFGGDAGDGNFFSGNCTKATVDNGHYVFFIDQVGNLYSGCDCDEDGLIAEDSFENVSAFSGNCSAASCAGNEVWP